MAATLNSSFGRIVLVPLKVGKISGNRITFSTPTQVMSILDNYQATISNGQMTGSWTTQDQPPLTGTFTLRKTA